MGGRPPGGGSWRVGRVQRWAQPPAPASLPKAPLPSSLITTCQSHFPSSLTCLQIFPNKERSCKHGNHLGWQAAADSCQGTARAGVGPSLGGGAAGSGEQVGHPPCLSRAPAQGPPGAWAVRVVAVTPLSQARAQCREPASEGPPARAALLDRALGVGVEGKSRTRYWHFCQALELPEKSFVFFSCDTQRLGSPPSSRSCCGSGDSLGGGTGVAFSP